MAFSSLTILAIGLGQTGYAHTVKTAESVAVTFHLEPNHNPRSGEPAQVWFVLTQKGGQTIPLTQCDCKLQVIAEEDGQAIAQPPLTAISAEQYQNIPGADVTFPQPGAYRLTLQGQPQTGDAFQPFQFSFPVTVAKGRRPDPSQLPQPSTSSPSTSPAIAPASGLPQSVWIGLSIGAGLSLILLLVRTRRKS